MLIQPFEGQVPIPAIGSEHRLGTGPTGNLDSIVALGSCTSRIVEWQANVVPPGGPCPDPPSPAVAEPSPSGSKGAGTIGSGSQTGHVPEDAQRTAPEGNQAPPPEPVKTPDHGGGPSVNLNSVQVREYLSRKVHGCSTTARRTQISTPRFSTPFK